MNKAQGLFERKEKDFIMKKSTNPLVWGAIGYLFLLIFRPFEYWIWLGDYHIERIYMVCLVIAIILSRDIKYIKHSIINGFVTFFLVICISITIAYDYDVAISKAEEYFKLVIFFFVIIYAIKDEDDFKLLIIGFIIVMALYIGKSLWEFFIHGRHDYQMSTYRLIGIDKSYSDPNSFAATVVYSLPFAWALWKYVPSKVMRLALIPYFLMSFIAVIYTGSRSGAATLILCICLTWVKFKRKLITGTIIVMLLLTAWAFLPESYRLRYLTVFDDSINVSAMRSAEGRIEGLKNGIALFLKSPIYGWGAGNFPFAIETEGIMNRMESHNLYGQIAAELGLLGIFSFAVVIYQLIKSNKIAQNAILTKKQPLLLAGGICDACKNTMILLLFQGNFGHNLYRYTWLIIGAFMVLGYSMIMNCETIENMKATEKSGDIGLIPSV